MFPNWTKYDHTSKKTTSQGSIKKRLLPYLLFPILSAATPLSPEPQQTTIPQLEERVSIQELPTNPDSLITPEIKERKYENTEDLLLAKQVRKLSPYRDIILDATKKENIPLSAFKAITLSENSKVDPRATSISGCKGFYQLSMGTARMEGLIVNSHIDERADPIKSTYAIARHLRKLYDRFGDDLTSLLEDGYHGRAEFVTDEGDTILIVPPKWYAQRILNIKERLETGEFPFDNTVPLYTEEIAQAKEVIIRPRDTIHKIAERTTDSKDPKKIEKHVDEIKRLNLEIRDYNEIQPGWALRVPDRT